MKRLLCILSSMNAGGAETFLMKVYRNLDRTRYQMDFCVNVKEPCFYEDEISSLGGRIYRIPSKSENLSEFKSKLAAIVSEEGYHYVLRITSNAMGFLDLKIAKKAGADVCCARSSNASDGGGIKAWLFHCLGKLMYNRYVDVKIAPSDLAAKYTFGRKAYKNKKVFILKNGVDLDFFKFYPCEREKVREEFSINSSTKLIGHVGRFDEQKNHMFLLEIFQKILEKDSNSMLLLVGKGKLEEKIRKRSRELGISQRIIFTGVRQDIPHLLSAMDVFILPSFYEGMPNTVIEAQATGLPCLISDTITKEADITGLVEYLPLEDSEKWSREALNLIRSERLDTKDSFIANKYDIENVVKTFRECVFGDE